MSIIAQFFEMIKIFIKRKEKICEQEVTYDHGIGRVSWPECL